MQWLHWCQTSYVNLLKQRYVTVIIPRYWCLAANFLSDTLKYQSFSPLHSRDQHLASSKIVLRVMSHQAGPGPTLHRIYIASTSAFLRKEAILRQPLGEVRVLRINNIFCFTHSIKKTSKYRNHLPLMYIFNDLPSEILFYFKFKYVGYYLISFSI